MLTYEQYCQQLVELSKLAADAVSAGDKDYAFFVMAEMFETMARDGPEANRGAPRGGPRFQPTEAQERMMVDVLRALS